MVGVRQFDEDELIASALDVFWRKGLNEATMQDLAAATGVQLAEAADDLAGIESPLPHLLFDERQVVTDKGQVEHRNS